MLLREELSRRLGKERCWKVEYPEGCKDLNDVLVKHGKDWVKGVIDTAVQWPVEGILDVQDMAKDIFSYYRNGYPQGFTIGIPEFDKLLTFSEGQLTVVTGIPGSGKSEIIDWIMTRLSGRHQWSWGVCSFENQPSAIHATKLVEKFGGRAFSHRLNEIHRLTELDVADALEKVDQYFYFINLSTVDLTLKGILDKAKELVIRKGIKGLLIDPWNYIEHEIPDGYSETQYVSECLTEIKNFALKNGVHVFLIAHPTKIRRNENGKYEVPTLYHISGSAHFFNKADNGFVVYRDFETGEVTVIVQKVRYSWLGQLGNCSFSYDTFTRQYKSIL
jgi:twinkle protein